MFKTSSHTQYVCTAMQQCSMLPLQHTYTFSLSLLFTLFDYYLKVCSANELNVVEQRRKQQSNWKRERESETENSKKYCFVCRQLFKTSLRPEPASERTSSEQNIVYLECSRSCRSRTLIYPIYIFLSTILYLFFSFHFVFFLCRHNRRHITQISAHSSYISVSFVPLMVVSLTQSVLRVQICEYEFVLCEIYFNYNYSNFFATFPLVFYLLPVDYCECFTRDTSVVRIIIFFVLLPLSLPPCFPASQCRSVFPQSCDN